MTDKLYYESSHRKDFEAQVISCEPEGEGYKVVLDKTVFFPEGGGQYADTGILGGVHVLDAQEKDGIIYHYTDGALTPGEIVKGEIDWEKRFESMQQHSGEHIISGIVHGRFGYNNVGFHLGADYYKGAVERNRRRGESHRLQEFEYRDSLPDKGRVERSDL